MSIQLRDYDSRRAPVDAEVAISDIMRNEPGKRFVRELNPAPGRPVRILACRPFFADATILQEERKEQNIRMLDEYLRELFLCADEFSIRSIEIPFFGEEIFEGGEQPLMQAFRCISDIIHEAIYGTSIENVYIRHDYQLIETICDELDDLLYEVSEEINRCKEKYGCCEEADAREDFDAERYKVPKEAIQLKETFGIILDRMIIERNLKSGEFVRRANISRQTLCKLRNRDAVPEKYTALACAIALELTYEEAEILLRTAGYCLSDSITMDVVVAYFIRNEMYDIDAINIALYSEGLHPLGIRSSLSISN